MILCLADGGPMVLQHRHIVQAKQMVAKIYQFSEALIVSASETEQTKPSNAIVRYLKKVKEVSHSEAIRYFRARRGMNAATFKHAMFELLQEGVVVNTQTNTEGKGRKGIMYYWKGGYK
jgi:ribosomal protein L3